jgi:hypothetical protein
LFRHYDFALDHFPDCDSPMVAVCGLEGMTFMTSRHDPKMPLLTELENLFSMGFYKYSAPTVLANSRRGLFLRVCLSGAGAGPMRLPRSDDFAVVCGAESDCLYSRKPGRQAEVIGGQEHHVILQAICSGADSQSPDLCASCGLALASASRAGTSCVFIRIVFWIASHFDCRVVRQHSFEKLRRVQLVVEFRFG